MKQKINDIVKGLGDLTEITHRLAKKIKEIEEKETDMAEPEKEFFAVVTYFIRSYRSFEDQQETKHHKVKAFDQEGAEEKIRYYYDKKSEPYDQTYLIEEIEFFEEIT